VRCDVRGRYIALVSSAAVPLLLLSLSLNGCGREVAQAAPPSTSTGRMAAALRDITERTTADPQSNIFLNSARAAALVDILSRGTGDDGFQARFELATERVRAGKTRDAIAGLDSLMQQFHLTWDHIAAKDKPVFDLAAIAYLRLGEQENCVDNPAANICILPLKGAARHVKQEGARGAISRYASLLKQFPDDRGSQWLLNIAYLQIGAYPDSVPSAWRVPNLSLTTPGAFPEYPNVAGAVGLDIYGHAGGVSIDDFNNDGLLDVFTTSWGFSDPVHVMLNDGRGGFSDRTSAAGLGGITGGLNTADADYDNDGDVDIVILRGAWQGESGQFPFSLLRNRGDGTFEDATFDAGLFTLGASNSAAWGDFNRDGFVDLFVGYESYARLNGSVPHKSRLFFNNRDGTFTEVAKQVGIDLDDFVKGVSWGDVNNDGLPDLYVSVLYGRNKLYMNKGGTSVADWHFEERAAAAGVELPVASFPTWFFDYDNDGFEDLFVPSYDVNASMHEMVAREYLGLPLKVTTNGKSLGAESSRLYHNRGDGTFEDVTSRAGFDGKVIYAMGSNFGDLDNDGFLDFYIGTGNPDLRSVIPNRMFHNLNGRRFEEVTLPGGFGHLQKGHAAAFADLDRDGQEDVFMVIGGAYEGDLSSSVLFHNPGWPSNSWINLRLQGTTANRAAIGARVEVVVRDSSGASRSVRRTVRTGGSFGAGPLELHVGLGRAAAIADVRVEWPDATRTRTSYTGLALNESYRVVQGSAPETLARAPIPFRAAGSVPRTPMSMVMPKAR
jgi:hypothetical protein